MALSDKKNFNKTATFLVAILFVFIVVYCLFEVWFYAETKNNHTINKSTAVPTNNQQMLNNINDNFLTNWKGVVDYINLKDSVYDESTKSDIKKGIENLKHYGSISGGVQTNEFADAKASIATLREQSKHKILNALSFTPYLANTIYADFNLKGADVGGRYSDKGFDSLYTYYENNQGARIALSEMQLKADASKIQIIKETLNTSIQGIPMTWQTIENGNIYNIRFVSGHRHYNISTQGIEKKKVLYLVEHLIKKNA